MKLSLLLGVLTCWTGSLNAQERFHILEREDLEIVQREIFQTPNQISDWQIRASQQARVVAPVNMEIYPTFPESRRALRANSLGLDNVLPLVARTTGPELCRGRIFFSRKGGREIEVVHFRQVAANPMVHARLAFFRQRAEHYQQLATWGFPGSAWFRHQMLVSLADAEDPLLENRMLIRSVEELANQELGRTFEMFSGGRAMAENLQLDRLLAVSGGEIVEFPVSGIPGIATEAMDWQELAAHLSEPDAPLAAFLPEDQHALLVPRFQDLVQILDSLERRGMEVLQYWMPLQDDVHRLRFYQKQMCVELDELARAFGEALIESVAVTGSDPYFLTGTDVALLFETKNPEALLEFIRSKQRLAAATDELAVTAIETAFGQTIYGIHNPSSSLRSYVTALEGAVVVSNSLAQLGYLLEVAGGKAKSLDDSLEFRFFWDRYPFSDESAQGFLLLTDATIRRWCGPRWRIGASRRTRAAAALADLQAAHLHEILNGVEQVRPIHETIPMLGEGFLRLMKHGADHGKFGHVGFLTPILELDLEKVTASEKRAYERFRDSYERRWEQVFDPIALQFRLFEDRIEADLTVLPLILSSDYQEMMDITRGVELAVDSGDPHSGTLFHWVMAINRESQPIRQLRSFASSMLGELAIDPTAWVGASVALFADQDPFWQELAQAETGEDFLEANFHRLPVGALVQIEKAYSLAAFLTGMRALIAGAAPGLVVWETRQHGELPYVAMIFPEALENGEDAALYYATTPEYFFLSFREDLLLRFFARRYPQAELDAAAEAGSLPAPTPWLGKSANFRLQAGGIRAFQALAEPQVRLTPHRRAFRTLPILNEYRRLFPEMDPYEVHARLWGTRLERPETGPLQWSEQWGSFEFEAVGHPFEPKELPWNEAVLPWQTVDLGLSFEQGGLRAQAKLELNQGQ
ncbi:MAG: hypothetical protein DWQ01_04725 [Planctomycetota bacterium]|nr:MAG: hypothetical protein DWQ01_04725 [Planctomycetota bacterium]